MAPHLDLEAAGVRLPHDDFTRDYQDGGQQTLALGGIKTGFRRDRLGLFLKVRSGAIRFSHTFAGSSYATLDEYLDDFEGHPTWQPVLDLGGVVEVYPVRHLVLRAEAGPTEIFYRATTFGLAGQSYPIDGAHASSLLLLFGGGLRF